MRHTPPSGHWKRGEFAQQSRRPRCYVPPAVRAGATAASVLAGKLQSAPLHGAEANVPPLRRLSAIQGGTPAPAAQHRPAARPRASHVGIVRAPRALAGSASPGNRWNEICTFAGPGSAPRRWPFGAVVRRSGLPRESKRPHAPSERLLCSQAAGPVRGARTAECRSWPSAAANAVCGAGASIYENRAMRSASVL